MKKEVAELCYVLSFSVNKLKVGDVGWIY